MKLPRTLSFLSSVIPAAAVTAMLLCPSEAFAHYLGITTYAETGCTCHSPFASNATSLQLTSETGQLVVEPGGTLTLTLAVSHASMQAAGVNIAVSDGVLAVLAGEGLRKAQGELTHTEPKTMTDGKAAFTFTWTAPATPGDYTLMAAGNAVNMNGLSTGDAFNKISQTITVGPVSSVAGNGASRLGSVEVFPNPVPLSNGMVQVRYRTITGGRTTVELYDVEGRAVYTGQYDNGAGEHTALLDTRELTAGTYFAIVRTGGEQMIRPVTVAR